MSLETEAVLDRRRLRRRVAFWRMAAIVAGVVALIAFGLTRDGGLSLGERRHIARVTIEGLITESREQLLMLKRLAESKRAAGVILYVNSPGGTTTGGEAIFEAMRRVAETKPVVAQFGTVAASAGYIAGLSADHIVARGNTITGSVGVIMQWPEVSELMNKLGVKINEIKSGPLKATPSPFQPIDEAGRRLTEEMVADSQRWFLGLVAARRGVATAEIPGLEQGRVYSGRDAVRYKLVDSIGGEADAVRWLEERHSLPKGLKVVDWKPSSSSDWSLTGDLGSAIGDVLAAAIGRAMTVITGHEGLGALSLDGLLSVWQPAEN